MHVSSAHDTAYYEVNSPSYNQAVDVPFVVAVAARDASHSLVTDNTVVLAISSNSPTMRFDTNNNGIFGEASDNAATLSCGQLYIRARDTVAGRGAIVTVSDSLGKRGSSDPYTISSTNVVSADGWAWQNPLPQGNDLTGVWGRSSSDVFVVGSGGTILHYNGSTWVSMDSGLTNDLSAVWVSSSRDVFAVGDDGVMHYDGVAWTPMSGSKMLRDISGVSPTNVFAVGDSGVIVHYDGTNWTPIGSGAASRLWGVWAGSSMDTFAVGDNGTIVHCDQGGIAWTSMSSGTTLHAVWGTSSSDVFAVGAGGVVLHNDGTGWTAMTSGTANDLYGVWGTSSSDVFAVGAGGVVLRYDGISWTAMSSGSKSNICGIWGSSISDVYAVGSNGTILHYDGSTWTAIGSGDTCSLYGIWGASSSDVFAVGEGGTILHYDGSMWTRMNSGTSATLAAVWGSSSSDVFAIGERGTILHYDGGTWASMTSGTTKSLFSIWGSSSSDVFVGSGEYGGYISHYDGVSWTQMASATMEGVAGLWGSSPSDVFAVGANGSISHYDGVSWAQMTSDTTTWFVHVWGNSSSDVFAVGDGGTIWHYDGSTWSEISSGTRSDLWGVWGNSSGIVAVGSDGDISQYADGASRTIASGTMNHLHGVWGTSSSSVFAVGDGGTILHYREPVPVAVTSITPDSGQPGETLDVVIKGSNLEGATALTFDSGVATNGFAVDSPSQISANITIAADTTVGARNVSVVTPGGTGLLYSGLAVEETAVPAGEASPSRMWILWVILGVLGAGGLGTLCFLLPKRLKKGEHEAGKKRQENPVRNAEEPGPTTEPIRREKPGSSAPSLTKQQPELQLAPFSSVTALKARMASLGLEQGIGKVAEEESGAETNDKSLKAGLPAGIAHAAPPPPETESGQSGGNGLEERNTEHAAGQKPAGRKTAVVSKVARTARKEPPEPIE